jgi:hypothetical protein
MALSAAMLWLAMFAASPPGARDYFTIEVVDDQTGRGVPLVELRTVDQVRYWTDSQGLVAFFEPGLMDQEVFFHVRSHGYEFPADGFGYRGKALKTVSGTTAQLRLRRINVAQRLYRVTGAGIYRDSLLLGREAPIAAPLVNSQVVGSDSVNTALFHGKIHWFWGDTNRPAYPLGTFHVPAAVSRLPQGGGLDPQKGIDLEYFTRDDGFAASTAEMPGDGPTWIDGLCVIHDAQRGERMFAKYVKVRKFLDVYQRGLVEFNGTTHRFEKVAQFDFAAPLYPHGHSFAKTVDGTEYIYFGNPYPLTRVAARATALADPTQYEAFTGLVAQSRSDKPKIDRDPRGAVHYGWKRDTAAPTPADEAKWLKARLLNKGDELVALRDGDSGRAVAAHAGSVAWNEFRRRFVMIAEQAAGTSHLGEIWYAEADTPLGPWVYARKIVTHDKYSFYNPKQHAMLDQDGGRRIFFEGTYSTFFSGNDDPTPRYDYNQVMYGLDLTDSRLALPVAVYQELVDGRQNIATGVPRGPARKIVFMALDRPREGTVPVLWQQNKDGASELSLGAMISKLETSGPTENQGRSAASDVERIARTATGNVAFYAIPLQTSDPPQTSVALYVWSHAASARRHYAVEGTSAPEGYVRAEKPLCRVWLFPLSAVIPWE